MIFDLIVLTCFVAIVLVYVRVFVLVWKLGLRRATLKKGSYTRDVAEGDFVEVNVDDDDKPDVCDVDDEAKTRATTGNTDIVRIETFRMSSFVQLLKKDAALMRRTIVIAALITSFFIFSWLPVLMIHHWLCVDIHKYPVLRKIVHLNTVANPVIYAITNRDFRESVRKLFSH